MWDWNLKSGSLMINSLRLKRSEDCNLNLITVGKLNTEVNSYVPFWQTTILNEQNVLFPLYLQRKECFTTVTYIRYISDLFYNYVHFFCFTANVLKIIMDNFDRVTCVLISRFCFNPFFYNHYSACCLLLFWSPHVDVRLGVF